MKSRTMIVLGEEKLIPQEDECVFQFQNRLRDLLGKENVLLQLVQMLQTPYIELTNGPIMRFQIPLTCFYHHSFFIFLRNTSSLQRIAPTPTSSTQTPIVSSTWISFIRVPMKPSLSHSPEWRNDVQMLVWMKRDGWLDYSQVAIKTQAQNSTGS